MKQKIHPDYHPVVFVDTSTGDEIVTQSTLKSKEKRTIGGVEHHVIKLEVTSYSHPLWTGTQKLLDTAGRVERFKKRFEKTDGQMVKRAPKKKPAKVGSKGQVLKSTPQKRIDRSLKKTRKSVRPAGKKPEKK